jgi:hypothetical protein
MKGESRNYNLLKVNHYPEGLNLNNRVRRNDATRGKKWQTDKGAS